jgi:O-antigen/teichoic acid export membrane protein
MPTSFLQLLTKGRRLASDPLYRGTLLLLINSGLLAALGFVFWTLAAREYPASAVGAFSGINSGISLFSAVASLGLQNLVTRHIASSANPRGLMLLVVGAITVLGSALCTFVVLAFGSYLPASLQLQSHGRSAALFTALVICTSLNSVLNSGLVAIRAPGAVLWTNLVGAIARLTSLVALASLRSSGLVFSLGIGLFLSTVLSLPPFVARTPKGKGITEATGTIRSYLATSASTYIATIFGVLPSTAVPLIVIARLGTTKTAPFALALLVSGFLNIIPSTVAQVLFAEASRRDVSLSEQLRKAIKAIYIILLPALLLIELAAPLIMHLFGASYAAQGANALRILSLATLVTAGNYLVDSILIATDRGGAYLFMNAANAALVLFLVNALVGRGIAGGATGYAVAQAASMLLGLAVAATGVPRQQEQASVNRASPAAHPSAPDHPRQRNSQSIDTSVVLSERLGVSTIADALDNRSLLSTTRPFRNVLLEGNRSRLVSPGEVIYLGVRSQRVLIDTGRGPTPTSVPILVAVSGYSGWISSLLVPSLELPDMLAGCWEIFNRLGGFPKYLVRDGNWLTARCDEFLKSFGVDVVVATIEELRFINATHRYLAEEYFISRSDRSFDELNRNLAAWLQVDNAIPAEKTQGQRAVTGMERVLLSMADRQAMVELPSRPAACAWHFDFQVSEHPYVHFAGNDYEVDPTLIGQWVSVLADLLHIRITFRGHPIVSYKRVWGTGHVRHRFQAEHPRRRNRS